MFCFLVWILKDLFLLADLLVNTFSTYLLSWIFSPVESLVLLLEHKYLLPLISDFFLKTREVVMIGPRRVSQQGLEIG